MAATSASPAQRQRGAFRSITSFSWREKHAGLWLLVSVALVSLVFMPPKPKHDACHYWDWPILGYVEGMPRRKIRDRDDAAHPYYGPLNEAARSLIRKQYREVGRSVPALIEALRLPRSTLYRELHRLGLAAEMGVDG